jgi:hypothetical protein
VIEEWSEGIERARLPVAPCMKEARNVQTSLGFHHPVS